MDAESQEIRQARQRASVKWLLSKAFNNRVPDNLKEPFYRDHENQERLKPQIIVEMGNATVYCDTLSNLYSDPNYQSLNHWSILQTLARKGVPVAESSDMPLTETVLIQTNPLRINAHMAVIESLMILYAKETTSSDRISSTIRRISGSKMQIQQDQSYEQALLSWISHACAALKKRIAVEIEAQVVDENGIRLQTPDIPPVRDFQDLCDGICLALLISYYCPKVIPWTSVRINYLPAVEDSIHNVLLVSNFSQKHLPYSVFHMTPEDITYMRGSMKLNLVVLLADLFNLFEIHPAKCVCYPGMDAQVSHSVSAEVSAHSYTSPAAFQNEASHNEGFVVHKSRGITTLSSMNSSQKQQEPLVPARLRQSKEKSNIESKADERGDYVPAGRPSNWEENRRPSYAGRRSRRNSSSEDSQLTIENFGGSQDQLNTLGRFDKERERDRERKLSSASVEPAMPVRSSIADARGTLQLGYDTDSGSEKQDHETEKYLMQRQPSVDNVSLLASNAQHNNTANISRPMPSTQNQHSNITDYTEDNLSEIRVGSQDFDPNSVRQKPSNSGARVKNEPWQNNHNDPYEEDVRSLDNASKLSSIRMKLEEKRRRIEQDKRKIESALIRHQEKQQTFGSQQHLTDTFQQRPMQQQQSFGSTPHLPHAFNSSVNTYNSRPPSRDPYQQMHPMPIQYINEHGQYMAAQQQQPPPPLMQQTQYMQPQNIYGDNVIPYNNHSFIGPQFIPHQSQAQPQYINRPTAYDDYSLSHQGRDINSPQPNHFYLHEVSSQPPPSSQRRTWSQPTYEHQQPVDINSWQPQKKMGLSDQGSVNWKKNSSSNVTHQQGFVLHHNDGGGEFQQLFQVHSSPQRALNDSGTGVQRQQSMTNLHDKRTTNAMPKVLSSPAPQRHSDDIMAPQSICFIGDEEDVEEIERNIIESMQTTRITADYLQQIQSGRGSSSEDYENELLKNTQKYNNITSGNLTYRIPSPSRPSLHANSFHNPHKDKTNEKGFYISFDDSQPKRPKPPLRAKRSSPKKEKYADNVDHQAVTKRESFSQLQSRREDDGFSNNINESKQQNSNNDNNTASVEINNSTYNKYTDSPPIQIRQLAPSANSNNHTLHERRHLGDVTNSQQTPQSLSPANLFNTTATVRQQNNHNAEPKAIVIGTDVTTLDPDSVEEMERRKEKIMLLSLQRRQEQEEAKARKEIETAQKREREREKEEERARKKEEQMARRAAILEQHRLKKAIEEAEREGKTLDRSDLSMKQQSHNPAPRLRQQRITRPRPKTIHVDDGSVDLSEASSISSRERKGSNTNLTGYGQLSSNSLRRDFYRGSQDSLAVKESPDEYPSTSSTPIGRRGSYKTSRDSGLGRATPPRRAPSPGMAVSGRHMPSPSGPGSLPPGLISKRRGFDDGSSDISSHLNSMMEYSGPKLYKQPAAKSNRGIILNAVEYCVFPGAVNREAKQKVLEKIARSEAKHFLVLFRDAGCQFRALYSYIPESDQVSKLFGTGPSQVDEVMFDKFFKYNSGGKCFSQVHTKHLTVTIDAFTIHNSLWQGKKVQLPSKKDMALVI